MLVMKRDNMNYPVSEFRYYSMVKNNEVVAGSVDKLIAEKWLMQQKAKGNDVYIVENLEKEDTVIYD